MFKHLIFSLVIVFMTISNYAKAEQSGTITSVSRVASTITIDKQKYRFNPGNIVVTYDKENIGIAYLNKGFTARYTVNEKGYVTHIEITGPKNRINDLFHH